MKIYTAPYFRKTIWFSFGAQLLVVVLGIVISLYFHSKTPNELMLYVFLVMGFPAMVLPALLFVLYSFYRAAGYVLIKKNTMQSISFFNRSWCIVSLTKPVYYLLKEIYVRPNKTWYIFLSNEPFDPKRTSLLTYNIYKQIACPYSSDTARLLPVDFWNCVE